MALAASTIRVMHRIAGEERHSASRLWMLALQMQAAIDWSLWVRRVDHALIGGDPILISRRVCQIIKSWDGPTGPRIAIIHPGSFSGAPLAALEDPSFRKSLGFPDIAGIENMHMPLAILREEIARAEGLLSTRGAGGVIAFELVQGLPDLDRDETVLRLTRCEGEPRRAGIGTSATSLAQIASAATEPRARDLYERSERLFRQGLSELKRAFSASLTEPPGGRRFSDLILAKNVELLSGFISPPSGVEGRFEPGELEKMLGTPYQLAGPIPRQVARAVSFWRQDFGRAANVPISS